MTLVQYDICYRMVGRTVLKAVLHSNRQQTEAKTMKFMPMHIIMINSLSTVIYTVLLLPLSKYSSSDAATVPSLF